MSIQQILLAGGVYTPPVSSPLDAYTSGLWAAAGIKQLLTSYAGALLRVRRSSDNAEMDVGMLGDGTLDTVSMLAWSGADSVFVTKAYDQSGAGNNFIQATAANQPRIVNAGVYDGFMRWDGTDDVLTSLNPTPANSGLSVAGRYSLRAAAGAGTTQSIWTHGNAVSGGHNVMLYQQQSNIGKYVAHLYEGTNNYNSAYGTVTTSEMAEMTAFDKTASGAAKIAIYRDGASLSPSVSGGTATTASFTAETLYLGSYPGSQPAVLNGKWFAVWTTNQSANGIAITAAI